MKQLKNILCGGLAVVLLGCATPPRPASNTTTAPAPAPDRSVITMVNAQYRFVVIDFAGHSVPAAGTQLTAFRAKKRIGAVRLTEPIRSGLATGDILEGELRIGDDVR